MLIVLGGRPGMGKTAIARQLARSTRALHLRIDSIEQALRNAGWDVEGAILLVASSMESGAP